jgi:hypothetical protein
VLFAWRGALPQGYIPIPGIRGGAWRDQRALDAASTATMLEGRRVAQVAVRSTAPAMLVATAMHEAFHVLEAASRRTGSKFGAGENSMLVSTYPVFDADNETAFALEGKLLAAALDASSRTRKREFVRDFIAVRRERHRQLGPDFVVFDQLSELHEGLAEYVLVRALQLEAREGPSRWRAEAERELALRGPLLDGLTRTDNLSLRFRFYQTGPAQALLLDALAGPTWKSQLIAKNATLQDMLGWASGLDDDVAAARAHGETTMNLAALRRGAVEGIARLEAARRAKVDSLLSQHGVRLVLAADSLPGRNFNSCGYDPQNLLQVTPTVRIQMRWWKPCAGGPTYAEFNVPSVQDEGAGTVSAVIGDDGDVTLTSNGQPVTLRDGEVLRDVRMFRLDAPRASVQAVRADLTRRGNTLTVYPKTP